MFSLMTAPISCNAFRKTSPSPSINRLKSCRGCSLEISLPRFGFGFEEVGGGRTGDSADSDLSRRRVWVDGESGSALTF